MSMIILFSGYRALSEGLLEMNELSFSASEIISSVDGIFSGLLDFA